MGMDGDLLAIEVRCLDQGLGLVIEHLAADPGADDAVDPARCGDLDDVDATADLQSHGLAAAFGPVTEVGGRDGGADVVIEAQPAIHMAAAGRDGVACVDDARSVDPAPGRGLPQGQGHAIAVAEIPDGGEACHQGLAGVHLRLIGMVGGGFGDRRQHALDPGPVAVQMDMAVDQAWQDEAVLQIDDSGARIGGGLDIAVPHRLDLAGPQDEAGGRARRLTRPVQQPAGMDDGDVRGCGAGRLGQG